MKGNFWKVVIRGGICRIHPFNSKKKFIYIHNYLAYDGGQISNHNRNQEKSTRMWKCSSRRRLTMAVTKHTFPMRQSLHFLDFLPKAFNCINSYVSIQQLFVLC